MYPNKDYESEISIRDLFFYVLYRWRSILFIALLVMAVLGGYKYYSLRDVLNSSVTGQEEQAYINNLNEAQEAVQSREKQYNDMLSYRNESIYFQLNPQAIWTASSKYLVKMDSSVWNQLPQGISYDPVDSILAGYTMPFSEITDDELIDIFGVTKPEYAHELVEIITDTDEDTITIQVKGPTKEYVEKGLDFIKNKFISVLYNKVLKINPHTLSHIGDETIITADKDLLENQETMEKAIAVKLQILNSTRLGLNELDVQGGPQNARKQIIQYIIIGFAGGAILMILLYIFKYVYNGRVKESREISEQYNLPLIAEFYKSGSLHNNRGLDKMIARWELGKKPVNDESIYNNISTLINEKDEIASILLVSSLTEGDLTRVREALLQRISTKEIETAGHFLTNSEAIKEAGNVDTVILVEKNVKVKEKI